MYLPEPSSLCDAATGSPALAPCGFCKVLLVSFQDPFLNVHSLAVPSWLIWNILIMKEGSDHAAAANPMPGFPLGAKYGIGGRAV